MAREPQPLIRRFLLLVLLPACALLSPARAGERATVLLASRPDRLILFNRYQQRLTSTESGALLPFELMIVEKEDEILGDGLTPCVALRLRGERFYLLREKGGSLPQGVSLIRGVDVFTDTLRVHVGRSVVVESPDGVSRRSLPGGTRLVRLFGHEEKYFVRESSDPTPVCGWVRRQDASSWDVVVFRPGQGISLARVRSVLDGEIAGVNGMLHALYAWGDPRGDAGRIPRLVVNSTPSGLRCVIVPPSAAQAYRGSFLALAGHLSRRLGAQEISCAVTTDGLTISLLPRARP
jgi:hypothetical protein